jgi:hypothetical protein
MVVGELLQLSIKDRQKLVDGFVITVGNLFKDPCNGRRVHE